MSGTEDWKIPAGSGCCGGCGAPLLPRQPVTVRLDLAEPVPRRLDLCAGCGAEPAGDGAFFWRRILPEAGAARPVVDYALLREVLQRLLGRPGELQGRLAYLVALVLVRKRQLRLKGFEIRAGREVMVVTRGAEHEDWLVPAPHLSAEDLVQARDLLTRLLAADLPEDDLAHLEDLAPAREEETLPAAEAAESEAQAAPPPADSPPPAKKSRRS